MFQSLFYKHYQLTIISLKAIMVCDKDCYTLLLEYHHTTVGVGKGEPKY